MIHWKIQGDENSVFICVKGHADYKKGDDIVCAGASTIVQSIMNTAEKHGILRDWYLSKGSVSMTLEPTAYAKSLADMLVDTLTVLHEQYPACVAKGEWAWT